MKNFVYVLNGWLLSANLFTHKTFTSWSLILGRLFDFSIPSTPSIYNPDYPSFTVDKDKKKCSSEAPTGGVGKIRCS